MAALRIIAIDLTIIIIIDVVVADFYRWNNTGRRLTALRIIAVDLTVFIIINVVVADFYRWRSTG